MGKGQEHELYPVNKEKSKRFIRMSDLIKSVILKDNSDGRGHIYKIEDKIIT